MDVLKLLQSKNRCLLNFLNQSKKFLAAAETGSLSGLQDFQNYRDATLKTLDLYDRKITDSISMLSISEKTAPFIRSVKDTQELKEELIRSILKTDQEIIEKIKEEKSRLLMELSASNKNNQMVKKFKSTWISESGEKLDGKL